VRVHCTVSSVGLAILVNNVIVHVFLLVNVLVVSLVSVGKFVRILGDSVFVLVLLLVVRVSMSMSVRVRVHFRIKLNVAINIHNMVFVILLSFKLLVIVGVAVTQLVTKFGCIVLCILLVFQG
jgi:hypothetical protein